MNMMGKAEPLTEAGLAAAAEIVGAGLPELWAVVTVETSGRGFLPDRRPVVLFERHEFSRRTQGRFDATHAEISGPPGGYGPGGAHQHDRLAMAIACDRRAALESTSWGLGQVMGYNAPAAGFADAEAMCAAMLAGEDVQLAGMARFIRAGGLNALLGRRDWTGFARHYNGPGYAANAYDTKLAEAHARLARSGLPDLRLRAAQLLLSYRGFDPGPVDGQMGRRTEAALTEFRRRTGLPAGAGVDADVLAALGVPEGAPEAPAERAPDVWLVQRLLAACGFDPGGADGRTGPRTRAGIAGFRAHAGLPAGEAADGALLVALRAAAAGSNGREAVRLAQDLLIRLGADPGVPDGLWGPRTAAALRRAGVTAAPDGGLSPAALSALIDRCAMNGSARTPEVVS